MTRFLRWMIIPLILAASISVADARSYVSLGIGPAYYTDYSSRVVWVPGHWDNGYWIPGQYVEYGGESPGPDYVWVGGGFGGGHHWRHGHWHHGGGGGHHHH